jgi:hypothetical protein
VNKLKDKGEKLIGSRRRFAKTLAVMAATPLVSRAAPVAAQETTPARPRLPEAPAAAQEPAPAAEALTEAARQRYPFLKKDDLEQIKRSIDRTLRNADRLKQFDLRNSDEPAFAFSADVARPADEVRRDGEPGREKQRRREKETGRREG